MKDMEKFIESQEMLDFLAEQLKARPMQWCEIIAASRAPIEDKANALLELEKEFPPDEHWNPRKLAEEALSALTETRGKPEGSVFILSEFWCDSDDGNENYGQAQTPYSTFEQALLYIQEEQEIGNCLDNHPDCQWFEISRWDLNPAGVLAEAISWYLSGSGVIWGFDDFRINSPKYKRHGGSFSNLYNDVNVRVPYQAGDMVLVDMSPFVAPFPAVIAEAEREDYTDCCFPQIVYINEHGKVDCGALKHIPYRYPRISPLLRLKLYDYPVEGRHAPLQELSRVIKGCPKKGGRLVERIRQEKDGHGKLPGVCWSLLKAWNILKEPI